MQQMNINKLRLPGEIYNEVEKITDVVRKRSVMFYGHFQRGVLSIPSLEVNVSFRMHNPYQMLVSNHLQSLAGNIAKEPKIPLYSKNFYKNNPVSFTRKFLSLNEHRQNCYLCNPPPLDHAHQNSESEESDICCFLCFS